MKEFLGEQIGGQVIVNSNYGLILLEKSFISNNSPGHSGTF